MGVKYFDDQYNVSSLEPVDDDRFTFECDLRVFGRGCGSCERGKRTMVVFTANVCEVGLEYVCQASKEVTQFP